MTTDPALVDPLPTAADPGEAQLRRDAFCGAMRMAEDEGRYGVTTLEYPIVYAWVVIDGRHLNLRIECSSYPAQAPTSEPWAPEESGCGTPLPVHLWPVGGQPSGVFRPDWSPPNGNAPYLACDRRGLACHPEWGATIPHRAWTPSRTLADYLDQLHGALVGAMLPSPTVA